jgi:hypothetical protein
MMLKLIRGQSKANFFSKAGLAARAFSTEIKVPTVEEIARNINDNQY